MPYFKDDIQTVNYRILLFINISINTLKETFLILLASKKCTADYKVLFACVRSYIRFLVTRILLIKTNTDSFTSQHSTTGVDVFVEDFKRQCHIRLERSTCNGHKVQA